MDKLYKLSETRVSIAGLMRCCTGSLTDTIKAGPDDRVGVGSIVYCHYENVEPTRMKLDEAGVWRWDPRHN